MTQPTLWRAVLERDTRADGLFVYAVHSTRVYCRPSCPSRRPRAGGVSFFPSGAMAEADGYRACRRCHPDRAPSAAPAMARVRTACTVVARRPDARWTVTTMARAADASVAQLQRAFRDVLGLTPRDYVAACRRRRFLATLRDGHSVTEAIYASGYGSPSRVYGAIQLPGMTPATYGRGGRGAVIRWLTMASPVGRILVASTARGLCFVEVGQTDEALLDALRREFPDAEVQASASADLQDLAHAARAVAQAARLPEALPVDIRGTAFQWRVWRALTAIPRGETRSYGEIARAIGDPAAARAVARACATNPLALVVPCHRVVPAGGATGGYRWGARVKAELLALERDAQAAPGEMRPSKRA